MTSFEKFYPDLPLDMRESIRQRRRTAYANVRMYLIISIVVLQIAAML